MNNILEYEKKSIISESYPVLLTVEPTNYCNLKCRMCPRELQSHRRGMMDMNVFRKIVDESHGLSTHMWLHYMGEPLLNPNIFQMIKYATDRAIKVGISTNGTLLNDEFVGRLANAGLALIIISLDASTPETYDLIRGEREYFAAIETGTEQLIKKLSQDNSNTHVCIQFVCQTGNAHERAPFLERWKQHKRPGVSIVVKGLVDWGGQLDYTDLGMTRSVSKHPSSCTEPYRTLVIHWNSNVSPCCYDYDHKHNLGNVNDQTIREIWNGIPMQNIRRGFLENNPVGICKRCDGMNSIDLFRDEFNSYISA